MLYPNCDLIADVNLQSFNKLGTLPGKQTLNWEIREWLYYDLKAIPLRTNHRLDSLQL